MGPPFSRSQLFVVFELALENGHEQDLYIQTRRPCFNVVDVILYAVGD